MHPRGQNLPGLELLRSVFRCILETEAIRFVFGKENFGRISLFPVQQQQCQQ